MFTKTELKTIEALMVEALGNQKRAGYELSNQAIKVLAKVQEVQENGSRSYTNGGINGNEYIDGTYRLWKQPSGSIGIKLDKQNELYTFPKDSDLYKRIYDLFDFYRSPDSARYDQELAEYKEMERGEQEWQASQERNLELMED